MTLPYRKVLCPIDFDDNSMEALDAAVQIARQDNATLFVLHVVPMVVAPGLPAYVEMLKTQEEAARGKLAEISRVRLGGLKHELMIRMGEVSREILQIEKRLGADLIVMATHGRKGLSRFLLGSVAEVVLREATCPVLTVHPKVPKVDFGSALPAAGR